MSTSPSYTILEHSSIALDPQGVNLDACFVHRAGGAALLDCEVDGAPTPQSEASALDLCNELRHALLTIDLHSDAQDALDEVAEYLARIAAERSQTAPGPVWASLALYNAVRREVWLVGECQARVDGVQHGQTSLSRTMRQQARRAAIRQIQAEGATDTELLLLPPAPTFEGLAPALNATMTALAIGAVNGTKIPPWLVTVLEVPPDVEEVVLATRGYPYVGPTLQDSEVVLRDLMQADPMGIDQVLTDDGWRLGTTGFADRTYLRLATPA